MSISTHIRNLWREVEDILTAATGPLLIVSSAISTSDIFSNETFSRLVPQLPAIWAIGRALAVTMWLGIAFEYYLDARRRGESGFWWFALSTLLFAVDLQTATLFAFQAEHISNLGEWAILRIPPIDWAIEQAILGVILIAVHRAVIHINKAPASSALSPATALVRPDYQTGPSVEMRSAPAAQHAYYAGPLAPIALVSDNGQDKEPPEPEEPTAPKSVTHHTRPRRRDSGHSQLDTATKKAHMLAMLEADPGVSLKTLETTLQLSRPTTVKYREEIRRRLWVLCPERWDEFRAAWGGEWADMA